MIILSNKDLTSLKKQSLSQHQNSNKITSEKLPDARLTRDLVKHIKRGHRWIFSDCIEVVPQAPSGLYRLVFKGQFLGIGFYQAHTELSFRMLMLNQDPLGKSDITPRWMIKYLEERFCERISLRQSLFREDNNSFRLIYGEGDGFPGLVIDCYGAVAVFKCDQLYLEQYYDFKMMQEKIVEYFPHIEAFFIKRRKNVSSEDGAVSEHLEWLGGLEKHKNLEQVTFKENGMSFISNIREGSKTGFFLDQRDNRLMISRFSQNKKVLNLFSYTGGFSLFAMKGGAKHVTSVDIAPKAILNVDENFKLNGFNESSSYESIAIDAFKYLDEAIKNKLQFDMVITDPPSFAPNKKSLEKAKSAYLKVFSDSIKLVKSNGLFVASSCSSHLTEEDFFNILEEALSKARKVGSVIYRGSQPSDHPFPINMKELKYLKFAVIKLDAF